jgi:glutamate dehydrogenase
VNIKIPLQRVMREGGLTEKDRNRLLVEMTDDVARLVLADNFSQNGVLGVSRSHAVGMAPVHARLVADLEARFGLDRELEVLPDAGGFTALVRNKQGLTSPELATLLAHVKLDLKQRILDTELPDANVFADRLRGYFPPALRERFPEALTGHPLRREIVTTQLVNEMVDRGGLTFAFRLNDDTVADPADAVRAYVITTQVFDLPQLWADIDSSSGAGELGPNTALADRLTLYSRRLLDRAARWFLSNRPQPLAVGAEISRFRARIATLRDQVPHLLGERESTALSSRVHDFLDQGCPKELAQRCARLLNEFGLLDVIEVSELADREHDEPDAEQVARLYFALAHHLMIDSALDAVTQLQRGDRWHALARSALREDLYGSLRAITLDVLRESEPGEPVEEKIGRWQRINASQLARARFVLHGVHHTDINLATLSVVSRQLRQLAP